MTRDEVALLHSLIEDFGEFRVEVVTRLVRLEEGQAVAAHDRARERDQRISTRQFRLMIAGMTVTATGIGLPILLKLIGVL